jgi:hypothetical protein
MRVPYSADSDAILAIITIFSSSTSVFAGALPGNAPPLAFN